MIMLVVEGVPGDSEAPEVYLNLNTDARYNFYLDEDGVPLKMAVSPMHSAGYTREGEQYAAYMAGFLTAFRQFALSSAQPGLVARLADG